MSDGHVAYDAYITTLTREWNANVEHRSWEHTDDKVKKCWEAVAKAVVDTSASEVEKLRTELRLMEIQYEITRAFRDEWRELYRELKKVTDGG